MSGKEQKKYFLRQVEHHQLLKELEANAEGYQLTQKLLGEVQVSEERQYLSGEVLFAQGDYSDGVYVVLTGQVELWVADKGGEQTLLSTIQPGDIFGEWGVVKHLPRFATAKAKTAVALQFIQAQEFISLYLRNARLRQLVDALDKSYQSLTRGHVIKFIGKFFDRDAVISRINMKDGCRLLASRVLGEEIHSLHRVGVKGTAAYLFEKKDTKIRELIVSDSQLVGLNCYGYWDQVPQLYDMVFDGAKLSDDQLNDFKRTGQIEFKPPSNELGAQDGKNLVCYCMAVSKAEILDCVHKGLKTAAEISDSTGASTMCGHCALRIQDILDNYRSKK